MSSSLSPTQMLLLFLLSLCICNISLASSSSSEDGAFRRWVSWNVENYRRETSLNAMLTARAPGIPGKKVVDWKLWKAEMSKIRKMVSQDGTGDYRTVSEALNSIAAFNTRRVILVIKPGIYRGFEVKKLPLKLVIEKCREKINVPRHMSFVTFLGDSSSPPTITGNDTASVTGRGGTPLKTFQSATVAVDADYFVAINIKFENTAPHEVGSLGEQAVALRISGTKAAFYNCSFIGNQDTLYDHKGLHYFNNCFIQGSVDFIFGYGRSLYENCHLNSVTKKVASLTAQKRTNASLASGFSFKNSTITGSGLLYLGRAWGDYSRVIYSYTFMDRVVAPQGWSDWGDPKRDARVYYGEYKCSGPGANTTGRVPWATMLTDEEAQPFLGTYYIEGDTWLPSL